MAKLTWEDLFSQGTLVDLDVGVWSGLARLLPGDLGIPKTDEVRTALTFGHERLVSKAFLQPIRDAEQAARQAVDDVSITFPLIRGSRYVPRKNREKLEARLVQIRIDFSAAVTKFLTEYQKHRTEMAGTLRQALATAAKSSMFVDAAMARLTEKYPTEATLGNLMYMKWRYLAITAPKDGAAAAGEVDAVNEAIGDIVGGLRREVQSKLDDVLALVARGGKITAKTFNSAKRTIDRIASLNVFGDAGLAAAVEKFRAVIDAAAGDKTGDKAGEILAHGLDPVKAEIAKDVDAAVKAAAARLTGASTRKML